MNAPLISGGRISFWRLILWFLATVLLWVFAHDYVASHINQRIEVQQAARQNGALDISWFPANSSDVVTTFGSEVTDKGYKGKTVAFSFVMPKWPLDPKQYDRIQLRFKTSVPSSVELVFEATGSQPEESTLTKFYAKKVKIQTHGEMQTHDIKLNEAMWMTESGAHHGWQEIEQAHTWVVRFFAAEAIEWQIASVFLPQNDVLKKVSWQPANCFNLPSTGHLEADCFISNRMVQVDHNLNQNSPVLTVKFNSWLTENSWQLALVSFILVMMVFIGRIQIQFLLLIIAAVLAVMLYLPFDSKLLNNDWLNTLMLVAMIGFVFVKRLSWWKISQKGSLRLWVLVMLVALLLWWQSDFSTDFLPLLPAYLLWAGFQQTLMVSLFEWLHTADKSGVKSTPVVLIVLLAWCFALLHMPNQYLMVMTFFGGLFWLYLWHKTQNLLLMVVSHSLWALLLYQSAGEAWLYSARVGISFL